jgi:hypothetical protein
MSRLADDPRWIFLQQEQWTCKSCEQIHTGLPDLAFRNPSGQVFDALEIRENSAITEPGNILTEVLCRYDDYYYVRALLGIPILGAGGRFAFGVWSTLSADNFANYLSGFDSDQFSDEGPWFSWLGNRLPQDPPGTQGVECSLRPQPNGQRPEVLIEDAGHPLFRLQLDGATLDQILDILAQCGHDIRPSLPSPTRH